MIELRTAIWLIVAALHLAVIVRAILLEGRDAYARAAWLLLLIALPVVGVILYLLFGEPWISNGFRERGRSVYKALLPFAPRPAQAADAAGLDRERLQNVRGGIPLADCRSGTRRVSRRTPMPRSR